MALFSKTVRYTVVKKNEKISSLSDSDILDGEKISSLSDSDIVDGGNGETNTTPVHSILDPAPVKHSDFAL